MLIFFVITGLPWSTAWGSGWSYIAGEVTPNAYTSFWEWEGPQSETPVVGDLDRAGNPMPWAVLQDEVPASGGSAHHDSSSGHDMTTMDDAPPAERVSLDVIRADRQPLRSCIRRIRFRQMIPTTWSMTATTRAVTSSTTDNATEVDHQRKLKSTLRVFCATTTTITNPTKNNETTPLVIPFLAS